MGTVRVVCTKNPQSIIIDFAKADNTENSLVTHNNLLKLRQYHTMDSQSFLPPLVLKETDGKIDITFDKPEKASDEEHSRLTTLEPRIKAEYNKFKHRGQNSTLPITEETLSIAYDIAPNKIEVNSSELEKFCKDLETSRRQVRYRNMKRNCSKRPLYETGYTINGD